MTVQLKAGDSLLVEVATRHVNCDVCGRLSTHRVQAVGVTNELAGRAKEQFLCSACLAEHVSQAKAQGVNVITDGSIQLA